MLTPRDLKPQVQVLGLAEAEVILLVLSLNGYTTQHGMPQTIHGKDERNILVLDCHPVCDQRFQQHFMIALLLFLVEG